MVVLGYTSTIPVTMEDMIHRVNAFVRGAQGALIIADMPFMTYRIDPRQALSNAARLVQEGGAHSVKVVRRVALRRIMAWCWLLPIQDLWWDLSYKRDDHSRSVL